MRPPKEFNIHGELTIHIDFNIEAETEEEARRKAKEQLEDFYHLNCIGFTYHNQEYGVEHKWDVYDEDPEWDDLDEENEEE